MIKTTRPRFDWLGDFVVPMVLPFVMAGAVLLAFSHPKPPVSPAAAVPHASAELCYAYYVWAKQAHDTSPGMERECSKP